jgi:hypothetical protein
LGIAEASLRENDFTSLQNLLAPLTQKGIIVPIIAAKIFQASISSPTKMDFTS